MTARQLALDETYTAVEVTRTCFLPDRKGVGPWVLYVIHRDDGVEQPGVFLDELEACQWCAWLMGCDPLWGIRRGRDPLAFAPPEPVQGAKRRAQRGNP